MKRKAVKRRMHILTDGSRSWHIVLAILALYEILILSSAVFPGFPGGAAASAPQGAGIFALFSACASSVFLLLVAPHFPRACALACCSLYAFTILLGYGSFLAIPALFSLYTLGRHATLKSIAITGGTCLVLIFISTATGSSSNENAEALISLSTFGLSLVCGIALRARSESAKAHEEELAERARANALVNQRDRAISQARIGAELHDSVGHGLTTIIALSEGLKETFTGESAINEALTGINEVARECLDQTREAVRALAPMSQSDDNSGAAEVFTRPHGWDDINPVLNHIRETGVACILTETGRRPVDRVQSDLAFAITREAVTNALRHAPHISTIVVSWNHDTDGSIALSISNDGASTYSASSEASMFMGDGSGLAHLAMRVYQAGGTITTTQIDQEWTVEAHIPSVLELVERKEVRP